MRASLPRRSVLLSALTLPLAGGALAACDGDGSGPLGDSGVQWRRRFHTRSVHACRLKYSSYP